MSNIIQLCYDDISYNIVDSKDIKWTTNRKDVRLYLVYDVKCTLSNMISHVMELVSTSRSIRTIIINVAQSLAKKGQGRHHTLPFCYIWMRMSREVKLGLNMAVVIWMLCQRQVLCFYSITIFVIQESPLFLEQSMLAEVMSCTLIPHLKGMVHMVLSSLLR